MEFIFDVDGTLVDSSMSIDPEFKELLLWFFSEYPCHIVTGASRSKTIEQLGPEICDAAAIMSNCGGALITHRGNVIQSYDYSLGGSQKEWLKNWLRMSWFPLRTGRHFDHRDGMCNFSIIGRNADARARALYVQYDRMAREREGICRAFNALFPDDVARVAGETGIDITDRKVSKATILDHLGDVNDLIFFGDKTEQGGNDYPLSSLLPHVHQVSGWKETFEILKEYQALTKQQ